MTTRISIVFGPRLRRAVALFGLAMAAPAVLLAAESAELAAARGLFESKDFRAARPAFEKILAAEPSNADAHFYLGQIAIEREDYDAAIHDLEAALTISPGTSRYHSALGDAYGLASEKAGVFKKFTMARKCLSEYERAVALDPKDLEAHERLFEYYFRAPSIVGGGIEKATEEAGKIVKLDPKRGHQNYATLDLGAGKYDLAFNELSEALKIAPQDYGALYQLGRLAAVSGQYLDQGSAALAQCLKLPAPDGTPSHSAVEWRLGNILEKEKDTKGARAAYEEALRLDPTFKAATDSLKNLKESGRTQ